MSQPPTPRQQAALNLMSEMFIAIGRVPPAARPGFALPCWLLPRLAPVLLEEGLPAAAAGAAAGAARITKVKDYLHMVFLTGEKSGSVAGLLSDVRFNQ